MFESLGFAGLAFQVLQYRVLVFRFRLILAVVALGCGGGG